MRYGRLLITAALLSWPTMGLAQSEAPSGDASIVVAALEISDETILVQEAGLSPESLAVQDALAKLKRPGSARSQALLSAVRGFYEHRKFDPVWFRHGEATSQARQMVMKLRDVRADGLQPSDYDPPSIGDLGDGVEGLAAADIGLSLITAAYIADLSAGHVQPQNISRSFDVIPVLPDIADALERLPFAGDMDAAVSHYEPQQPQYQALKAKLTELLDNDRSASLPRIEDGRSLKLGKTDPRVAVLRVRLAVPAKTGTDPHTFDEGLHEAVTAFQTSANLTADGIVGPRTLSVLNGVSREEQIAALITNMERWRWLPRELGQFRVEVNVPEFRLRLFKGQETVHATRVVVGKQSNPTPIFSDQIEHLVVNPYWNVPTSILKKEMLPAIRSNPSGYFAKRGYQVLAKVGGRTRVINPAYVDWYGVNPRSIRVRQRPGSRNALGRIKFMFPNQHAVYLHDTPSKSLFKKDYRAYSHGCVRVHNPLDFADALLVHEDEWNAPRIERLYGGKERRINLSQPIPVHLTYFTARIDEDGSLMLFDDVYGHDGKMRQALGL